MVLDCISSFTGFCNLTLFAAAYCVYIHECIYAMWAVVNSRMVVLV